jgi:hypothetical protein
MVGDPIIPKCLYYTSIHPPYSIRVSAYTSIRLTLVPNVIMLDVAFLVMLSVIMLKVIALWVIML